MAAKVRVDIVGDSAGLSAAFVKAQAEVSNFEARMKVLSASMTRTGATLTRDLTLPLVGIGVAAGKMAIDFQRQMLLIQTQAGASAGEVKKMSAAVLDLARSSASQGPTQLAQGLYHLESVGLRGANAIRALKTASDAAGMGIADLETVTNALGAAVTAGIKGSQNYTQAMGTLDATIGAGNMRMEDLAGSLGNVVATAKAVGVTLPELGAAMAVLTDRGMNADEASTRLRMTFALMEKPSAAAAKHLADMGLSSTQLADAIRTHGLGAALELLQAAMQKVGDKTRATQDLLGAFGGGRSGTAILTLIQSLDSGISSYGGKLAQIDAQSKNFSEKVAAYHETAAYKIDHAWAGIQADLVQAGAAFAPIAVGIAQDVQKIADAFNSLSPTEKKFLIDMAGVAAVVGPAMLVTGKFVKSILALNVALKTLGLIGVKNDIESVGGAAAANATKVDGLRLALTGLGRVGLVGAGVVVTYEVVKKLLEPDTNVTSVAPGQAGAGAVGSGPMGGQVFQRGGKWYETYYTARGAVTVPISASQAAAFGARGTGGSSPSETAGSPRNSANRTAPYQGFTKDQLKAMVVQTALKYGIDPGLALAQINQESGFNPIARSGAGAEGIAQFMPGTAKGYGINPLDPRQALPAYGKMMSSLISQYGGNVALALAAYNAGSGNVAKFLAGGSLPAETMNYVSSILGPNGIKLLHAGVGATTVGLGVGSQIPVGGSPTPKKPAIVSGANLLPSSLRSAIDNAAQQASATQGAVAAKWLNRELDDLKTARGDLEKKLGSATGAQKKAIESELHSVNSQIDSVNRAITSNLKAQAAAIKTAYTQKLSTARSNISSAVGLIKSDLDNQLQAQLQSYIDNVLGPRYYQGTNANGMQLQTPAEAQLAAMQAQDTLQGLQDALTQAQTPEDRAAAQRALDEYNLSIQATKERAQADHDYAEAVKKAQDAEAEKQRQLDAQIDGINKGLQNGTKSLGDLQAVADKFGVSLSADDGIKGDFDTLSSAVKALSGVLASEASKLVGVGDTKDAAAIQSVVNRLGGSAVNTSGGSAIVLAGGGARMMKAADGGFVVREGLAVIHKGETVVPAGRGSGTTIHVHVAGSVVTEQQLSDAVYRNLLRRSKRNGGGMGLS